MTLINSTLNPPYPTTDADRIVNCVVYKDGSRLGEITVEAISDVLEEPDTFVWLGLREPTSELLDKIQEEFGLHELAMEDARSAHQRPKLEEYGDCLFLVFHTVEYGAKTLRIGETHIFIGKRFLVTLRHGSTGGYARVREHCEAQSKLLAKGPGYALYALMDAIVDRYMPVVEQVQERFEAIEAEVFGNNHARDTLEQLYRLKRELLWLSGATEPLLTICNELMRFHADLVPKDIRFYFRDIHDHVQRLNQTIDREREMLTAAMNVHLALIGIRQNDVVKQLAGWGAILAVPTLIFSLYGMNFKSMPELDWVYGYPFTLMIVTIICCGLFVWLRRAKWL